MIPPPRGRNIGRLLMPQDATRVAPVRQVPDNIRPLQLNEGVSRVRRALGLSELPQGGALEKVAGIAKMLGLGHPGESVEGPSRAMAAVARTGKGVGSMLKQADNVAPIKAYHGSPHDFDKFDISKIGTGEGAQAYGHGLYFAESEDVAKHYREALTRTNQKLLEDYRAGLSDEIEIVAASALLRDGNPANAKFVASNWTMPPGVDREKVNATIDQLAKKYPTPTGKTYEVAIKADPEQFLDWDAPLPQQPPAVQAALERAGIPIKDASGMFGIEKTPSGRSFKVVGNGYEFGTYRSEAAAQKRLQELVPAYTETGELAYRKIAHQTADNAISSQSAATQRLREAGIPGIRYLDGTSRSAGTGSRNYVVFDDSLVEILRKYGLAGLIGSGAGVGSLLSKRQNEQ
jgi:hypothetical protein